MTAPAMASLRESSVSYNVNFAGQNSCLRPPTILGTYPFEFQRICLARPRRNEEDEEGSSRRNEKAEDYWEKQG
jgi:hypothetical protein